jgi:hypothetical protein
VERFTFDAEKGAVTRSYTAEDPLYLQQPYTGADTVYLADVPYQPAPCDDQSYKKGDSSSAAGASRWPWAAAIAVAGLGLGGMFLLRRRSRAA